MEIIHLDSIDSTNNFLKERIHDYPCGDVAVFAREQTAGRGNGANSWHSEAGENLTFSFLVHPKNLPPADSFVLSEAVALALAEALSAWISEERIKIKWPNDIYIVPQGLKLSGTLIETVMSAGCIQTAIVGVGLNVNELSFPEELPNPVSMAQIVGHKVPTSEVADAVLKAFEKYYGKLEGGNFAEIRAMFHSKLYLLGIEADFADSKGEFRATIKGVAPNGQLILIDSEGKTRKYGFKEIKFSSENGITNDKSH